MGAHPQVRPPPPSSSISMAAHHLLLILLISAVHIVKCSDSDTLLELKNSLINGGDKLPSWNAAASPCNWDGVLCTNGTIWGIRLEGKGLQGTIDTNILAKLPSLVTVSFQNNKLAGAWPEFKKLHRMRTIFLSHNRFSGEIPANALEGMNWLKKLYLGNNNFTGLIPSSLKTLPRLKELMIENNGFQGKIPNFDKDMLTHINFTNNQLQGPIPQGLRNFHPTLFSGNGGLCGPPLGECPTTKLSTGTIIVIAAASAVVLLAAVVAALITILYRRRKQQGRPPPPQAADLNTAEQGGGPFPEGHPTGRKLEHLQSHKLTFLREGGEKFELPDLLKASAEVMGGGVLGSTYKAALGGGRVVVVKRLRQMNDVGKEEFQEHMRRLGKLEHPNLLPIVAFYYRKEEKLFVSDYIDNQSLALHLHGDRPNGIRSPNWATRLKIVKGVARGLLNLYNELPTLTAPHGHLKSSNVLLTATYEPILTDYGLVPITNHEHAHDLMVVYKSPEYKRHNRITKKTDVWCLGVLILEILTGKTPTDTDLTSFIESVAHEELTLDVFDKNMVGSNKSNEGEMVKLLKIGLGCCESEPDKRWDVKEVVERIEEVREKDVADDDFYSTYSSEWDPRSRRVSEDLDQKV